MVSPTSAPAQQPEASATDVHRQFETALRASLADGHFVRLSLGKYHGPEAGLQRVLARLATLQGGTQLSLVYRYKTRDVTKNFTVDAGVAEIMAQVAQGFRHAHLTTTSEDIQLAANRRGEFRLQRGRAQHAGGEPSAHDRDKPRLLDLDRPFLAGLGITNEHGQLVPAMARKWKQVNKFLEILEHAIESSGLADRKELRVVDFGAGKGYLTFAVHDYLTHVRGMAARVTGVELRADLVALCNGVAAKVGASGLTFEAGSIGERMAAPAGIKAGVTAGRPHDEPIDVLIALHACDTATDEAMGLGVRAGAAVIMCSPCCHKELRPQMHSPLMLRPMLRHGIHLGQEAEMVTDSLRALLLEAKGYAAQVFEFVSLEHTSKNKMILALKRDMKNAAKNEAAPAPAPKHGEALALAQVREIKSFYGIREQRLESLLRAASD